MHCDEEAQRVLMWVAVVAKTVAGRGTAVVPSGWVEANETCRACSRGRLPLTRTFAIVQPPFLIVLGLYYQRENKKNQGQRQNLPNFSRNFPRLPILLGSMLDGGKRKMYAQNPAARRQLVVPEILQNFFCQAVNPSG